MLYLLQKGNLFSRNKNTGQIPTAVLIDFFPNNTESKNTIFWIKWNGRFLV